MNYNGIIDSLMWDCTVGKGFRREFKVLGGPMELFFRRKFGNYFDTSSALSKKRKRLFIIWLSTTLDSSRICIPAINLKEKETETQDDIPANMLTEMQGDGSGFDNKKQTLELKCL